MPEIEYHVRFMWIEGNKRSTYGSNLWWRSVYNVQQETYTAYSKNDMGYGCVKIFGCQSAKE